MLHRLPRPLRILALICAPSLLFGLAAQQPAPPPATVQPYTYTGTVHAVSAETGSLDLITGVGHALRLVHMSTLPTTQTMSGVVAIRFVDIAPGDEVRAACRMTASGLVADRIDRLSEPGRAP
jgi:hypothetical protein